MAISAAVIWEVRTTGNDGNGGGFKEGASGTDYSQQDSAQISRTDLVIGNPTTTNLTSAATAFTTAEIGNLIQVTAGTGFTVGFYEITAVDGSNVATVDRSVGTAGSTGGSGAVGGALLTVTKADANLAAGNDVYVKNGTYGELVTVTTSGANGDPVRFIGYNSTRTDAPTDTTRPVLDGASTRANCVNYNGKGGVLFMNFRFTGATGAGVLMSANAGATAIVNCRSHNNTGDGFDVGFADVIYLRCESDNNGGRGIDIAGSSSARATCFACYIHDNTTIGINAITTDLSFTISETNSSHGVVGTAIRGCNNTVYNNTGASSDGFSFNSSAAATLGQIYLYGNISQGNGRYGYNRPATTNRPVSEFFNFNQYNGNTTAGLNNITAGGSDSTADASFTNAGAGDFSIGTALKALGYPGTLPGALSVGYLDMGAVQRQETGGGLLTNPGMAGGMRG